MGRPLPGRSTARRALLRAIKPHTAHQAALDDRLATALRELADRVDDLAGAHLRLNAQTLRETRQLDRRLAALESGVGPAGLGSELTAIRDGLDDLGGRIDELSGRVDPLVLAHRARVPLGAAAAARGGWRSRTMSPAARRSRGHTSTSTATASSLRARWRTSGSWSASAQVRRFRTATASGSTSAWSSSRGSPRSRSGGAVLDAGSALNHLHVLDRLRDRMDELDIVTLAPEPGTVPDVRARYVYADLRSLPMRDATYDRVVSISTLEHVGMDNAYYGAEDRVTTDPQPELLAAVRELRRVLKPGGECLITVPGGRGGALRLGPDPAAGADRRAGHGVRARDPRRHVLPVLGRRLAGQ